MNLNTHVMRKYILIFFLFLFTYKITPAAHLGKYYFKHLGLEQGLSQNSVLCILQDSTGFIWIGTKDGLNRYDGISFRTFKYKNSKDINCGLGNNVINSMCEDHTGNIWVGTDAGIYIYHPETESFSHLKIKSNKGEYITQPVNQITADKNGNLWIAVEFQGMFFFDFKNQTLTQHPISVNKDDSPTNINSFCIDRENTIWIGIQGNGLYYTNNNFSNLNVFTSADNINHFSDDNIYKIIPEDHNRILVGSAKGGLKEIDIIKRSVTNLLPSNHISQDIFVRNILQYSENELWIASESGIFIYNTQSQKYLHLEHNSYDPYSLSDNAIYTIYKDRENGIWVGSYFGGIDYYPPQYANFEKYYPLPEYNSISGKTIREFCEDNQGYIWIGTEDAGLNKYDPVTRKFTYFSDSKLYHNIHALCLDGNYLWIGTYSGGLHLLDLKNNRIVKHYVKGNTSNTLNDNNIYSMYKTSSGDIYIGTMTGLNKYNRETDDFIRISKLNGVFIYNILEDHNGNLWFASYTQGLFKFNPRNQQWKNFRANNKDSKSLPYDKVISIYEDSKKRLWVTTQGGGFSLFNPENETFTNYNSSNGLPNDVVYRIVEDHKGMFWMTTNEGLCRFNPENHQFKIFTTANGLLSNQFNYSSGICTRNNQIYFGCINGFITFNPNTFIENENFPPVVITDFLLFNKKTIVGEKNSPLEKSITYSDKIELNHKQNSFALRFSALSYIAQKMNHLSYTLKGFDKEWYTVTDNPIATYTNLKPGRYVFCVKSANSLGEWNENIKTIEIIIHPPFWLSPLAYGIYSVLLILSVIYTIRYFKIRMLNKQKRQMERLESEKEREIYRAKVEFFTNVAHEIRTPLTLIKGPLENILKKEKVGEDVKEDLNVMDKNTQRLLNLTNQLLDFRKTEAKGFALNFVNSNISELIRETYSRFLPTARQNNLVFEISLPEKDFYAPVDKEALTKILSNLFNNAVKYANSHIQVILLASCQNSSDMFSITVINDGIDIPKEMQEEIFKPFVQIKNTATGQRAAGTGIGLPLARSLAELHKGKLYLKNGEQDITFCVELPKHQENVILLNQTHIEQENHRIASFNQSNDSKITLLVVEDDPEMQAFVSRQLENQYTILTASNGIEALNILEDNAVNLIISDVMMPEMDGFELCRKLKSDVTFSHIPIILLTAKATLQSKIEGIELGADAYIEKPFSTEYLLARIHNLLNNQEKLRKAFASSPFVESKTIALSKADETFLEKLNDIIQKNIAEVNFNIDTLAEEMNMSRSSLHRKIKGISKLTPNEFIQLERLKKAAQLILSNEYRINEVCYIVGFNSSSYFAKCFQKQFGVLPKDFGKQNQNVNIPTKNNE